MKNIILVIVGVIVIGLAGLAFWSYQPIASKTVAFICGTSTVADDDNNIYNTVKIGTQCWMASNLKVGTRIIGTQASLNNSITEKYCYDNLDTNCTTYGGLYPWDEAMGYSITEGAKGICPANWHIPSDAQQYALVNFLKDTGQTCNAIGDERDWGCSTAGAKLKSGGTSGFNGVLAGSFHYVDVVGFNNLNFTAFLWSSSQIGNSALGFGLVSDMDSVGRGTSSKDNSFSVRCIKN